MRLAATLAAGLPVESRCKRRAAGLRFPVETLLLAKCADVLELLLWRGSVAAERGERPPDGVLSQLMGKDTQDDKGALRGFESAEAFRTAWES